MIVNDIEHMLCDVLLVQAIVLVHFLNIQLYRIVFRGK
jgi:hypothetical protein